MCWNPKLAAIKVVTLIQMAEDLPTVSRPLIGHLVFCFVLFVLNLIDSYCKFNVTADCQSSIALHSLRQTQCKINDINKICVYEMIVVAASVYFFTFCWQVQLCTGQVPNMKWPKTTAILRGTDSHSREDKSIKIVFTPSEKGYTVDSCYLNLTYLE